MNKNKTPARKSKLINWDSLSEKRISKHFTVGEFLKRIEEAQKRDRPWHITDPPISSTINKLRADCLFGTETESQQARAVLKKSGLDFFIPRGAGVQKTEDHLLRYWQNDLDLFFLYVITYRNLMRAGWEEGKGWKERREKALESLFKRLRIAPGEKEKKILKEKIGTKGRVPSINKLALEVFAVRNGISSSSTISLWNKKKVSLNVS